MKLLDLYKKHINSEPDGLEIHNFMSSFNQGLIIPHPDPEIEKLYEKGRIRDEQAARDWIYKNSKL